ncbi:MAG: DMT family transporter [Paracoccaceae bacterium]
MTVPIHRAALLGILCMLGAVFFGTVLDVAIKFLSSGYALHQIILIRTLVAIAILVGIVLKQDGDFRQFRTRRVGAHFWRTVIVMLSNVCFFTGLAAMPFADALAIAYVAPLLITGASAVFLGEKVGPHRWGAVLAGLIGVVVMLRPGAEAIRPAALLVLLSSICYGISQLMTRQMRETESTVTLNIYLHAGFLLISLAMGLVAGDGRFLGDPDSTIAFLLRPWVWPPVPDWPILVVTGISVAVAGLFVSQAYRLAEAALVAPFEYLGMPLAIIAGVVVFGTWPDTIAWIGIALIGGAGLYVLWRETLHRSVKDPATPVGGDL